MESEAWVKDVRGSRRGRRSGKGSKFAAVGTFKTETLLDSGTPYTEDKRLMYKYCWEV